MKQTILSAMSLCIAWVACAQTVVDKTIPLQRGQTLQLHFDYPELVRITTWEKNEVAVHASVSINSGENDDAFEWETSSKGNVVSVRNRIKDFDKLPHRITIHDGGKTITFRSEEEYRKFRQDSGRSGFERMSKGVDMDIVVEVKVPRNVETHVKSVYGMLEVNRFDGPLVAEATYGGIDASLTERGIGLISAETNYGEIYTNFDARFDGGSGDRNFYLSVSAKPGNGPRYAFGSKYGNVYLRKAN